MSSLYGRFLLQKDFLIMSLLLNVGERCATANIICFWWDLVSGRLKGITLRNSSYSCNIDNSIVGSRLHLRLASVGILRKRKRTGVGKLGWRGNFSTGFERNISSKLPFFEIATVLLFLFYLKGRANALERYGHRWI